MHTLKTKSALSWFGSDSEVAGDLAKMLNHCTHITIPFCGGCAIVPHLKAGGILAADKHDAAINFYKTATGVYGKDNQKRLFELCSSTLNHPTELAIANNLMINGSATERAWAFWALCWLPRKGKGGTKNQFKASISVRYGPGGGDNASRIKKVAEELPLWAVELSRCSFVSCDFRELIPKIHDSVKSGVYVDFVWVDEGSNYLFSATEQDHIDLAELLGRFTKTTVVVRYGDHPLIRSLYKDGWTYKSAVASTQSNSLKREIWITNNELLDR